MRPRLAVATLWLLTFGAARAAETDSAAQRMLRDVDAGIPLVAHVVVALADNEHQGIVRIPQSLGDGDRPQSNLYWGAMYGVKGFLRRSPEWKTLTLPAPVDARVLDRVLFRRQVTRDGKPATVYLLAEAWQGRHIEGSIRQFLEMTRGQHAESIRVDGREISAGGAAHLIAYVGHNGLMDFAAPVLKPAADGQPPRVAVVLACYSDDYFAGLLRPHAAPLVTTASLMAPEAYVLDAVVTGWFAGAAPGAVVGAAADAYARYQKISNRSAQRIFHRNP
jgi:hypothetical protein